MNFKAATDHLTRRVSTIAEIAEAFGVSRNTIERARMEGAQSRPEPARWQQVLARLARERARELLAVADDLDPGGR